MIKLIYKPLIKTEITSEYGIRVLGGLELFGFTGIIIGPLALALALEFIRSRENPQ